MKTAPPGTAADSRGSGSSYPGGKSGSGVWQRLINEIPPHRVLIVPFAGRCGVTRRIKPAEQTIVIDRDEDVCQWWDDWRRTPKGRSLEIHHCDGIEWMRYRFKRTLFQPPLPKPLMLPTPDSEFSGFYSAKLPTDDFQPLPAGWQMDSVKQYQPPDRETVVLIDPPYVMSTRTSGRIYTHEMSDDDHQRLLETVTSGGVTREANVMVCGYASQLYAPLQHWRIMPHEVMTRGGLRKELVWMNYEHPKRLHDTRFIGVDRRERERIRRQQKTFIGKLNAMPPREREAMLDTITQGNPDTNTHEKRRGFSSFL